MRGQESKNRRNPLIYIRLSSVRMHLYPHFRSLCNQVSNLRPVRWIILTFPNAKDTAPTANSSHARRGSSAASGCPILRTAAVPGRWLRTRMRQPSTTWCCRPSWPKERPPSGSCAGCWDSPEDAENARRPTRRRKSEVAEEGKIPLDPILMRLQMEMRLVIADFEYSIDRHGNRYG